MCCRAMVSLHLFTSEPWGSWNNPICHHEDLRPQLLSRDMDLCGLLTRLGSVSPGRHTSRAWNDRSTREGTGRPCCCPVVLSQGQRGL